MVTEFTNFSYHFQFKILNHIIFLLSKGIITANPQVRQILIVTRQPTLHSTYPMSGRQQQKLQNKLSYYVSYALYY